MKNLYITFLFTLTFTTFSFSQNENFSMRQLGCGLSQPWEIKFGPDSFLWVTEANSYELTRIDPSTGIASTMLDLSAKKNFANYAADWPQGGLQGFAFHPSFNTYPYIYIAYVYRFDGCLPGKQGCFFKTKIVRYNYDMTTKVFSNEKVIADTIPGSTDHNGGRLVIGPASAGMDYIFYSVGDMGAGHMGNGARQHRGQQVESYEGKILRFNLITDTDTGYNAWIPNDNPFNSGSNQTQSAVWSLGHRNPQGLAFAPDGTLYEAEHGPYSDDEINIIKQGYNYGFPLIVGYADGNYDGSKAGAGSGIPAITSEATNRIFIELNQPYSDPIGSYFAASKSEVSTIYTNDLNGTPPYNNYYLQWPTIAPSGIDYYSSDAIPGWKNSLLVANLKLASVYRLKLSSNGSSITMDTITYFKGLGRFRDIAISPDGKKIYVACDSMGTIKGAPGVAVAPPNKGCILEFTYPAMGISSGGKKLDIKIYPNPATGFFTLALPVGISNADVSISNIIGEKTVVSNVTNERTNFSTVNMAPGVYFVEVSVDGMLWTEKIIIK